MITTALIFAAGRGERLRPLTDHLPKALCRVHGIPLIEHHVARLAQSGFTRIVINHAYLGGQIRRLLQKGQRYGIEIIYSPEPPGALETGGAIIQALPFLGTSPFLTLSADIFTDYPFAQMHLPEHASAHLVLAPVPPYLSKGDFTLNDSGWVAHTTHPPYTFGNLACFHPALFQNERLRRVPLGPFLKKLVQQQKVSGEVYRGTWINVGSLEQLLECELTPSLRD
jgi:MurNAc alpha-1-phosphate uridylyltransferase